MLCNTRQNSFYRLESTRTLEDLFRSDSEKLLTWLANAMDQLLTMKKLPDTDQQSIGAIRRRSDKLLVFIHFFFI